jgi:hypothetical protein
MARVNINQAKKIATARRLTVPYHRRTVELVFSGAKRLVPRGDHRSGSGARKPGSSLYGSLHTRSNSTATTLSDLIGSDKQYAASEHQGSSAHYINSHGRKLKFEWERGNIRVRTRRGGRVRGRRGPSGNFFFFVRVRHPGNKRPVRYLTTPMHLYGRIRGYRTSSARVNRTRLP